MTITIKTENQELFDNLLWFLENFKDDVEITTDKSKWGAFADRMSGLTTPEITDHIQKTSEELRGRVEKKLPKGFTEPIEIESYDSIASKEEIHKR